MSDAAAPVGSGLRAESVRVLSGSPTEEELAAVVAVLASAAEESPLGGTAVASNGPSGWARSQRAMRVWDHGSEWGRSPVR